MKRLNREEETAIRSVARLERVSSNREMVEGRVARDCLQGLVDAGYLDFTCSDPERAVYDRVERLTAGRCYFDERRRDRWRRWAPVVVGSLLGALIGGAFTIAGVLLGASLS